MMMRFMPLQKVCGLKWSVRKAVISVAGVLILIILWIIPWSPLFDDPFATVVYDRNGRLLAARIAGDGQWRFPPADSVPYKLKTCITGFEDRYFMWHPGFNPVSFGRAVWQNIRAGKVVSGGSTLTMQTIRLSRKGKSRTIGEKLMEMALAVGLEIRYSKRAILNLYASHAPYGGNTVGLGAASWRYFGRPPDELSWAEAALLAVLPNAPSAMHPGRNRDMLLAKRNRLLRTLQDQGFYR